MRLTTPLFHLSLCRLWVMQAVLPSKSTVPWVLASASDVSCDQRLSKLATEAAMSNVLEQFMKSVQLRLLIGDVTGAKAPILAQNEI